MMQRKKVISIILQAACGAVIGASVVQFGSRIVAHIPALELDRASLAHRQYLVAAIPWVLFSFYWELAAKNAAVAKSSETKVSRRYHVLLANMALVMEIAPIHGLGRFLPISYWIMAGGFAVEAFGLLLTIWARRILGRNWSGEISIKVDHQLIRSGPYRSLRHPIYTGLLVMYAGAAIVTGEALAILGFALAVFAYWRKIRLEEANLNAAFGAEYDAYRRESWALVPGVF